jgi:hypothetical protein
MTAYYKFLPSPNAPFIFTTTFDGAIYTVTVLWNLSGQRYYVQITDQNGALIVNIALIGSPNDYDISMTAGYFTTKLIYRTSQNQFEVF